MDHRLPNKRPKTIATDDYRLLNDDVLTEILLYLPAQSLLRFKTVCKSWCNIIDSSSFRKLYLQNESNNNNINNDNNNNTALVQLSFGGTVLLIFSFGFRNIRELSVLLPDHEKSYRNLPAFEEFFNNNIKFRRMRIAGPANGLVCIYCENGNSLAVCNPSIGKIKILPQPPMCSSFRHLYHYSNSLLLHREIRFGFDYVTKDNKVVQLLPCQKHHVHVHVYSRTTNAWRELASDTLDQNMFIEKRIKSSCKNGSFAHWRARRRVVARGYYEKIILSFDMQNEVFQTMLIPDFGNIYEDLKSRVFAKDDHSFVLVVYDRDEFDWRRKDKWLKIYELKITEGNARYWSHVSNVGPFVRIPRPLALWKSDVVVLRHPGKGNLSFYDYSTHKIRKFMMDVYWFKILVYEGSVISP